MADSILGQAAYVNGQEIDRLFISGSEADFVFGAGKQILPKMPVDVWGVQTQRFVTDAAGIWFEFGFRIDKQLTGNASAGYTDPGNYFKLEIQRSTDLVSWTLGNFTNATVPEVNNGDGTWTYWSRCNIPRFWTYVTIDMHAVSTRYGKSITAVKLFDSTISLPGYPYAMPAAAATLQADLRSAGYTGATVSSTSHALSVDIINHYWDGSSYFQDQLYPTMSGTNVTMVTDNSGTNISLPSYPYSMPSQAATLQTDLRAAGRSGAVVRLFGDEWRVDIPDRATTLNNRPFDIIFTPDDPHPAWNIFGTYLGNVPDNTVTGTYDNLRATTGLAPIEEEPKQFVRLKITAGTRYNT